VDIQDTQVIQATLGIRDTRVIQRCHGARHRRREVGGELMPSLFLQHPSEPRSHLCQNAFVILCNAHDTSSSFLDTFKTVRRNRTARGTPTDEEQDLLRAMLLFASGGLDSLVKQLVRDALPTLLKVNLGATLVFKTFVERRLRSGKEIDHRLLADVFADQQPRERLVELLVEELCSKSLQSREELLRVGAFFDIPSPKIVDDPQKLIDIFRARNQIAHEMDVDFTQSNRSRRPRARKTIVNYTNEIFKVANAFLVGVDSRLPSD